MAVAPLNLTPSWQPWHLAGLSCLLLSEEAAALTRAAAGRRGVRPDETARPQAATPADCMGRTGRAERAESAAPAMPNAPFAPEAEAPAAYRSAAEAPPAGAPATRPARAADQPELAERAGLAKRTVERAKPAEAEAAPATWPAPWRELLAKMQPAPLAWTYPELGEDLLLAGDKRRSAALREMIARLRLPRGSSTFWPTRLPEAPAERPESDRSGPPDPTADYFRAGLQLLEVRFLIVFGPDALAGTAYETLRLKAFSEQLIDGRLILTLPGFSSLLAVPSRLDKVVFFLDSVLSRFLRG